MLVVLVSATLDIYLSQRLRYRHRRLSCGESYTYISTVSERLEIITILRVDRHLVVSRRHRKDLGEAVPAMEYLQNLYVLILKMTTILP